MKTFDLIFNGTVLPAHNPEQVKRNLAQFLCINDSSIIDELFCGEKIVLRGELDRKAAASYFREIVELGGDAAVVPSHQRFTNGSASIAILQQHNGKAAELIRESQPQFYATRSNATENPKQDCEAAEPQEADQIWPVSTTRRDNAATASTKKIGAYAKADENLSPGVSKISECTAAKMTSSNSYVSTRANLILASTSKELARLEAEALQTREESVMEISRLRVQQSQREEDAANNLAQLRQESEALTLAERNELANIDEQEEQTMAIADETRLALLAKEKETRKNAEEERSEAMAAESDALSLEQQRVQSLEEQLAETKRQTEQEIQQLEELLAATRSQAEIEISEIELEISTTEANTKAQLAAIETRKEKIDQVETQQLDEVAQEQQSSKALSAAELEALIARRQTVAQERQEQIEALSKKRLEITASLEQSEAEMENACAEIRQRTEDRLNKLKTLEQVLQERQAEALECLEPNTSSHPPTPVASTNKR